MDAAASADTRTVHIHNAPTEKVLPISDKMARTTERLEADFSKLEAKILRFPHGLRAIGGDGDRYIVPSVVAIGPYHHGRQHLQKMEEVKLAAAYYFCRSGFGAIPRTCVLSVAGAARGCYDTDDPSLTGLCDADFATMMFLDGCFLLEYMARDTSPVLLNRMTQSTGPSIEKDIFLLENQIPWLVLEALMVTEFMSTDVHLFVDVMGAKFLPGRAKAKGGWCGRCIPAALRRWTDESRDGGSTGQYRPPHLLGLLRFAQVGSMPENKVIITGFPSSLSSSAVELAQIGVRLRQSREPWFGDMWFRRDLFLFGELSLSPLFLNDVTACWLVNMAAELASTSGATRASWWLVRSDDGFVVSSYLLVLAMLMDSDDDVQQLRAKRVLHSTFSNKQALRFFKGLAQHLGFGGRYVALLMEIDSYKRHRAVRIAIYKLFYNSFKAMTIATLFSIVGVLVGIFKTLLDNKKH
ncbi:hypothetical protein GQ55_6G019100 [Panicum hallii var. hallii]|uniref:Uncharacterized protein n=1 Tax=Panicum hallii var. hallii TaxID=1504633 RepID=A0A2T7D334_9POAL|nr:hypothetical protein GQ55_6G019100 [Panicum hallii var. hallii]